jgi:hypothetical protein
MAAAADVPSQDESRSRPDGTAGLVFAAVTVVPTLLAAAWLLPGLPLLLGGAFDLVPMVVISVLLAVGLCVLVLPRLPGAWPVWIPSPAAQRPAARRPVPWWAVAATVGVAVVFAGWQVWMHTQQVIYLRDPNIYLQTGYWIAHHGSLPIPQSLGSFGNAKGLSFSAEGYFPRGSGIVPQFMTGYPMVIAGAVWIGGLPAALVLTPIVGGCAVLVFGGLAGRLIGPRWAPAAAAVLALCLPQQYTSRTTFSEPLAEVLLFGSLSLLADSLITRRATAEAPAGAHAAARRRPDASRWAYHVLAFVAGLTLGLTILVRLDGLSDILPVVPFLGVVLAVRWRGAIPFAVGLVVGVGYGLLDGYVLSRPYLQLETPSLHPLALITAAVVLLTVLAVAAAASPKARALVRAKRGLAVRWLPDAAAVLVVLVFIGFAVRPLVQTVAGETDPNSIAYVAELQKLAHLPVDGKQQYYQDSLYWVIWYIGLPTVLLGAAGLAVLTRRGLRALLTWQDPDGVARIWALPLMIALWVIVTVLWRPAVSPDQPWASRRLVPFVLPGLILGAVWASSWLKQYVSGRVTSVAVASCAVAALAIPTLWTTFGISLTPRPTAHGMAFKRIGAGELNAVRGLCAAIPANASVVILDQLTGDRFAQVTRGICDAPAAILDNPSPAAVAAVIAGIERAGRHPVLLAQSAAELAPYGGDPREVVNLPTTQEAHELTTAPERTWNIHYTVWMSTPTGILPIRGDSAR